MDQAERLFDEIVIDEQSCPISHDHIYHQTDHFSVQPLNANASLRCSFSECNNLTFHHKPNLLRHTRLKHSDSLNPIHLKAFRNCRRTTQSKHVLKNVSTTRFKCSMCDNWFECLEIHVIQEHTVIEVVTGGFGEFAKPLESDVGLEGNREMHQQPQHQTNNKLNDSTNAKPMKYAQQLLVYSDSNETNDSDEESLEETDLEGDPDLDEQSMNETDFDGEKLTQPGQQPPQYDLNKPTNEPKADSNKHSMQSGSIQDNLTLTAHPFEPQVTELDIAIENHAKTFKKTTFDCTKCYKSFRSNKSLRSHTEDVHPKHLKYCGVSGCQKYFKTRPHLYRHYGVKHKEVNFPCDQCRNLEHKNDLMVKHLQTCHQISFVLTASSCLNRSNPNATQSTPNKSNPISVQSNVHLNQLQETPQQQEHQDIVSSNPTQPEVKSNSTLQRTNLILNPSTTFSSISTHKPEPQVIELSQSTKQASVNCPDCGKIFTNRKTFWLHCINMHPKLSPHCEVSGCGKTFETKIHLIKHYHLVHGGVSFPCKYCYHRKDLVVDHLRIYHQIDFDPPKTNFDHSSLDSNQSTTNPISFQSNVHSNVQLKQPNPSTHLSTPISDCIMLQFNSLSGQPVFSNLDQFNVNLDLPNPNSINTKSNSTFENTNLTLNSPTSSSHSNSPIQSDPGESTFHCLAQMDPNHDQFSITSLEPSIPILINSNSNIDQINLAQTNPNPDQFSITSLEPSIPIVINSSRDQINLNEIVQPNCLWVQSKDLNHHRQSETGTIQFLNQSTNAMPVEPKIIVTNIDGHQNIITHQAQPLLYSKVFDQMLNPSEQQQSQRVEEQIQNSADSEQSSSLQDISDFITFNSNQNQDQSNLTLTQNAIDSQSQLILYQPDPIQCSSVLATDVDSNINFSLAQTQISLVNNSSPSPSLQSSSISPPPNVINDKRSNQKIPVNLWSHVPGQDSPRSICTEDNCGKTFCNYMTMKRHQRIVHQGQLYIYRCTWVGCGLKFPGTYQLKKHREQAHTGVTVYTCDYPECNKTTTDKGNMTKHRQLVHEKAMFMCKYANCGQMFTYYGALRAHRRSVHTAGGKHKCEVEDCGMGFDSIAFLRRHCEQKHKITDDHL